MQAADTPLDLDDRWALGHISPAWPGNGAERTEFRTYSGGGGRAGVRAQGVGTGWGHLAVHGDATGLGAEAMGVVEGYLTAKHIQNAYLNNMAFTFGCTNPSCVPKPVADFMAQQEAWTRGQVANNLDDKFWQAVGGVMKQYDGMQTGVTLAGVTLPDNWRWLLVWSAAMVVGLLCPSVSVAFGFLTIRHQPFAEPLCGRLLVFSSDLANLHQVSCQDWSCTTSAIKIGLMAFLLSGLTSDA